MDEKCQLYVYNADDFSKELGSENHFATTFTANTIEEGKVSWLNFHGLDKMEIIERFCDNLGVDRLVFEDIYTEKHRPKLEEYEDYMFFSIRSALPAKSEGHLPLQEQISFILGKNYLISLQEKKLDYFGEVRERIELKKGKIREKGPDFLLFRMLDAITDNYYKVMEDIAEYNRKLETVVIRDSDSETLQLIEFQKRKIFALRKIVMPLKEITMQMEKVDNPYVNHKNRHYFTDLKESCMGVLDDLDTSAAVLEGMINLYYAVQGQRMNEIMKLLTVVSTIFIPLTFIVGVYGMNFKYMPELDWHYGYLGTWILMILITVALIIYFIRKGWLGKNK